MTRKTRSPLNNLLSVLYDLVDDFWQIGVIVSFVLAALTALVTTWALNAPLTENGNTITQMLAPLVYIRYLLILGPAIPMVLFTMKTYRSWSRH